MQINHLTKAALAVALAFGAAGYAAAETFELTADTSVTVDKDGVYTNYFQGETGSGNTFTIKGVPAGIKELRVVAGYQPHQGNGSEISGNTLTLSGADFTGVDILHAYGAEFENDWNKDGATYKKNSVIAENVTINAEEGSTTKRHALLSGGGVYAANLDYTDSTHALENDVTVRNSVLSGRVDIVGGANNNVDGNTVTITGDKTVIKKFEGAIWGGHGHYASHNTVNIEGGTLDLYGEDESNVLGTIAGGNGFELAQNNNFNIKGGSVSGNIVGGYSLKEAHGNVIHATGGAVDGALFGAVVEAEPNNLGESFTSLRVSGNGVIIDEGVKTTTDYDEALTAVGGFAIINRDNVTDLDMTGNWVEIGKGVTVGDVYGNVLQKESNGPLTVKASADLNLEGATVLGDVAVLRIIEPASAQLAAAESPAAAQAASNVTVNLGTSKINLKNTTVTGTVGGVAAGSSASVTGNSEITAEGVNKVGALGSDVNKVTLNVGTENLQNSVLTFTEDNTLTGVAIIANGLTGTTNGDYKLIGADGATVKVSGTLTYEGTFTSDSMTFDGSEVKDGEILTTTEIKADSDQKGNTTTTVNENAKTLAESLLGSVALINQGAEFMASEGLASINAAAREDGVNAFGVASYGSQRYETGSHVNVDGGNYVFGAATKVGSLTLAGYGEIGYAESDAHVKNTKSDGKHTYYGVGLGARYDFEAPFYVEGTVRVGQGKTKFDGYYGSTNEKAHYDAKSVYTSAHVGAGYVFDLTDSVKLDTYGRYLVSYLGSDTVTLGTVANDKLKLDSTTSQTVQIGTRAVGAFNDNVSWKVGAAYEHVSGGDADSWVNGQKIVSPSVSGNSGIFEAGIAVTPSAESPWKFDLGVKGYVGDRKGATGSVQVQYLF